MSAPELAALRRPGFLDGIDVSAVQGAIDWPAVAEAGFRFAVIKASEGANYCDPRALQNLAGARAAGLRTGVYMFARVSQGDAEAQAERLWTCIGDTMPSFRLVLDLESAPAGTPGTDVVRLGEALSEALERRFGRAPILYSYPSFLRSLGPALAPSTLARCPLWIAQYSSTTTPWAPDEGAQPAVQAPWTDWAIWQYSGNGGYRVPGVPGDCDRNLFKGDEAALADFCGEPGPDELEPDAAIIHPLPFADDPDDVD